LFVGSLKEVWHLLVRRRVVEVTNSVATINIMPPKHVKVRGRALLNYRGHCMVSSLDFCFIATGQEVGEKSG
jgi:hypothetical protein